jgi:putative effector of murein hydrolase
VVKFISVVIVGFFYSMVTTAYTVLFLRSAQGKLAPPPPPATAPRKKAAVVARKTVATPTPVAKAYRDETMSFLLKAAIVSGIVSILATNAGNEFAMPIRTVFFFFTTFASYVWGARLPSAFTKIVHPLILSTAITLSVILGTSVATADNFITVLKTYKTGTYNVLKMGAADIMLFLLGPSVVSFAISMYNRRFLLRDNFLIVIVSMIVSSVGGLFGTAAYVRLLQLGGKVGGGMIRLSTLSRNVTTALAIACTNVLKGDVSLAVLIVVLTGVLGATYGRTMLDTLKIHDPVTRGLAVGGAAQGLGVTSMMPEADAYPFAAMSMILTAISATVLVSIPSVNHALVTLAQGNL